MCCSNDHVLNLVCYRWRSVSAVRRNFILIIGSVNIISSYCRLHLLSVILYTLSCLVCIQILTVPIRVQNPVQVFLCIVPMYRALKPNTIKLFRNFGAGGVLPQLGNLIRHHSLVAVVQLNLTAIVVCTLHASECNADTPVSGRLAGQ